MTTTAAQPTATTVETAAAMRKALRNAFPGVKFSVRLARGTAYGWINVDWTDGPTAGQVEIVISGFRSERYNGMTDSYEPIPAPWSCCGVIAQRSFSQAAFDRAVAVTGLVADPAPDSTVRGGGIEYWVRYPYTTQRQALEGWLHKVDLTDEAA